MCTEVPPCPYILRKQENEAMASLKITDETEPQEDDDGDADEILKPGLKIRPDVSADDARKLAERLYGIVSKEISELMSYDDRNFLIHADR